jgi:hypothetical protein
MPAEKADFAREESAEHLQLDPRRRADFVRALALMLADNILKDRKQQHGSTK